MEPGSGELYVVATPIGNLGDLSERARRVLADCDRVVAEDSRRARALLSHLGLSKPVDSLHEHNEGQRVEGVLSRLQAGAKVALISDAGTPLISDPGYRLVRACGDAGVTVRAVPGPSSVIAALSIAGLPTDRFCFEGFLPAKPAQRRQRLAELDTATATVVLFESCHRVADCLADMLTVFGPAREIAVAREISKQFEEVFRGPVDAAQAWLDAYPERRKGEFVLMIRGRPAVAAEEGAGLDVDRLLAELLTELPTKKAARIVAAVSGLSKNDIYKRAIALGQAG